MINSTFRHDRGPYDARCCLDRGLVQYRDTERGWSAARRSSASTVHCRLQVHAVKEVALRWSALTRPVAHASGTLVDVSILDPDRRHRNRTIYLAELYRFPVVTFVKYLFLIYHFVKNAAPSPMMQRQQ